MSPVGEGGLTSVVKELLSKLLDVVGSLLGMEGGGGSRKAKTAKARSSKSKKTKTGGGSFTEAFEAMYGQR